MFLLFLLTLLMTFSEFNVFVLSNTDETCSISENSNSGSGSSSGSDPPCSKNANKNEEENRFRSSWNKYLTEYQEAQESYEKTKCHTEKSSKLHCDYVRVIQQEIGQYNEITTTMIDEATKVANKPVTYVNLNGSLYRSKADCQFPSRCQGVEHFLFKLSPNLPDFQIVINNHDWPYVKKRSHSRPIPLFSFSKTSDYWDIFYPAWTFWAGGPAISKYPTGLGRWDLLRKNLLLSAKKWPWSSKTDSAFFRGSRTSSERDSVVMLSRKKPDLIDAAYTKNQAWRSKADTLGEDPSPEVSLEDHCKFKYLFNFRGVAASFRLKHLFMCNSLVLHVGSEWLEFFYPALKPWVHYIPVESNASSESIEDLLEFLRSHEKIAISIAQNGHLFIKDFLKMYDVEEYWAVLLTKYAQKLSFKPTVDKTLMKRITK